MGDLDDLVKDFLVESTENIDKLDQELMALEQNPAETARLAGIFRNIHTIKGTSGFFGFNRLQAVCHAGESLLAKLRDGVLVMTPEMSTALLAMSDRVRSLLAEIGRSAVEGEGDDSPLIAALKGLTEGTPVAPPEPAAAASEPASSAGKPAGEAPKPAVEAVDATLRVDVQVLDRLMNLVGELVLTRNQILSYMSDLPRGNGIQTAAARLNSITTELQEGVMKTRLQPISGVWSKLPRIVRDLSMSVGKRIRVEMQGKDTELDKAIIEAIKDPLTHMVRNSVDHGLETPDERRAAGKPEEGVILLRAFHDGGQVVMELVDDGRGIPPDKVKRKALEKGLITQAQADAMNDREAVNLIFAPGFSTAEKVTSISGRGVGMDVVRTNIEHIGGTVDVLSRPGRGTTITVRIPLTLAIVPALIVTAGEQRFAIPQVVLRELVSVEAAKRPGVIEQAQGSELLRLRGTLLPLISLPAILGLPQRERSVTRIVVVEADQRRYGLIVDGVNDTQEIVVKPMGGLLKHITVFSGATIQGDGHVALILDVVGIASASHLGARARVDEAAAAPASVERRPVLIFRSPDEGRMAIALSEVSRLEEMPESAVERIGDQEVVQYRGDIMPLVRIFTRLSERRRKPRSPEAGVKPGRLPVVVCHREGRPVGLVVGQILDTASEDLSHLRPASRAGIRGCFVTQGKVTELLDVPAVTAGVAVPAAAAL